MRLSQHSSSCSWCLQLTQDANSQASRLPCTHSASSIWWAGKCFCTFNRKWDRHGQNLDVSFLITLNLNLFIFKVYKSTLNSSLTFDSVTLKSVQFQISFHCMMKEHHFSSIWDIQIEEEREPSVVSQDVRLHRVFYTLALLCIHFWVGLVTTTALKTKAKLSTTISANFKPTTVKADAPAWVCQTYLRWARCKRS